MRFSAAVALAAATAPLAVSAKGRLGYAVGVRKPDASCKTTDDFVTDFKTLKGAAYPADYVRTYSVIDKANSSYTCSVPAAILPAAKQTGMKVVLGLWADTDDTFQQESDEVLKYASQYSDSIYAFTIGSEGLYRNEQKEGTGYTAQDILSRINKFKNTITSDKYGLKQKVGTADSWNKYQDGTADPLITGGVNFLLVNAFGYWQGQLITNATATYLDDLQQAYGHIQSLAGSADSIELWNGETGWPTKGGTDYNDAKAGTDNAQTFYTDGVCAALDWNFDLFYFEAFNEPWKPLSTGLDGKKGDEAHWGAFDENRQQIIPDLSCNWS